VLEELTGWLATRSTCATRTAGSLAGVLDVARFDLWVAAPEEMSRGELVVVVTRQAGQ